jgi:hypothetical protein
LRFIVKQGVAMNRLSAILLALFFVLSFAAGGSTQARATARAWVSYVRIQGDRAGQAGWHQSISRIAPATIAVNGKPTPTPTPRSHTNIAIIAQPSPSPTPNLVIACTDIVLSFSQSGQPVVTGVYSSDTTGGCLFAFASPMNAPRTGQLAWRASNPSNMHLSFGTVITTKIKQGSTPPPPDPPVTLRPNQTIQVEIGYDGNTNTTHIWPR